MTWTAWIAKGIGSGARAWAAALGEVAAEWADGAAASLARASIAGGAVLALLYLLLRRSRIASLPPIGVAMRAAALLYAAVVLVVEVAWIGALVYGAVWLVTG